MVSVVKLAKITRYNGSNGCNISYIGKHKLVQTFPVIVRFFFIFALGSKIFLKTAEDLRGALLECLGNCPVSQSQQAFWEIHALIPCCFQRDVCTTTCRPDTGAAQCNICITSADVLSASCQQWN